MKEATKLASGQWFFEWDCGTCMDSGVIKSLLGPETCKHCQAWTSQISARVFGAVCVPHCKQQPIDDLMFNMARALVSTSSEFPTPCEALESLLGIDDRQVKRTAKRLKDEWLLPVIGRREKPYGYHFAASMEELLAGSRTTRAQAISELATDYRLLKANSPIFAGQFSLINFVTDVSTELQEAIR